MNDKRLTEQLQQLAEDAVQGEANLWPAVRAQLEARPAASAHLKGRLAMNTTLFSPARRRWVGLTLVAGLALAAALLVSPQGRALAQTVWLFFNPAAAQAFDVDAAVGAAEPSSGPTAVAPSFAADTCGADLTCQLAAAEAAVGIDALELPSDVAHLSWTYVEADAASGLIRLGYTADGGGGLVLSQSSSDLPTSVWEAVPEGAAQAVTVNGAPAEYVEGTFVVYAGATEATWEPTAPLQRLRWSAGGKLYELAKMGDPEALESMDLAALVALAERLH
jgi:hypothetical protein